MKTSHDPEHLTYVASKKKKPQPSRSNTIGRDYEQALQYLQGARAQASLGELQRLGLAQRQQEQMMRAGLSPMRSAESFHQQSPPAPAPPPSWINRTLAKIILWIFH